jgi:hypothetical protein
VGAAPHVPGRSPLASRGERRTGPLGIVSHAAGRGAAWLARQSGGLEVPSSNLGAPIGRKPRKTGLSRGEACISTRHADSATAATPRREPALKGRGRLRAPGHSIVTHPDGLCRRLAQTAVVMPKARLLDPAASRGVPGPLGRGGSLPQCRRAVSHVRRPRALPCEQSRGRLADDAAYRHDSTSSPTIPATSFAVSRRSVMQDRPKVQLRNRHRRL